MNQLSKVLVFLIILQIACNLSPETNIEKITPKKQVLKSGTKPNPTLSKLQWWKEFQDKNLDLFIKSLMENSLDLKNTGLIAEKFKLLYRVQKSALWPQVSLSTGGVRTKTNLRTFLPQGGSFKNTSYSFSFNISYEVDLFKKLSNTQKQALYNYLNSKETQNALRLSVIANGVSLYLQYSQIQREISLLRKEVELKEANYRLAYEKYINGIYTSTRLLLAKNDLKNAKNNLFQTENKKKEIEKNIKDLLSRINPSLKVSDFEKISKNLRPIQPGLPGELLLRRPDIKAKYYNVKSKISQVGISKANLFPSIKLTGSDGFKTTELGMLFQQKSNVWDFGINILQPIFNRGALRNNVRISKKELEIAINDYKQTVITAFHEVDFLLDQYSYLLNELNNQKRILLNSKLIKEKAFEDYLSSNNTYENLINQELSYINQEIIMSRLYLNYALNRVQLYKALGGGMEKIEIKDRGEE